LKVLFLQFTRIVKQKTDPNSKRKQTAQAIYSEIYVDAKGVPDSTGIFFVHSRHVEAIILMTRSGSGDKK